MCHWISRPALHLEALEVFLVVPGSSVRQGVSGTATQGTLAVLF